MTVKRSRRRLPATTTTNCSSEFRLFFNIFLMNDQNSVGDRSTTSEFAISIASRRGRRTLNWRPEDIDLLVVFEPERRYLGALLRKSVSRKQPRRPIPNFRDNQSISFTLFTHFKYQK